MSCTADFLAIVQCGRLDLRAIGGCFLALRASGELVIDGDGCVERIYDVSGLSNHAGQPTPERRPVYAPNGGPNGTPALVWDANDRGLVIEGMNAAALDDMTLFAVLDQTSFKGGGASQRLLHQLNGMFLEEAGSPVVGIDDPAVRLVGPAVLGPQVLEYRLDKTAGTVEVYRNAVSIGSDTYDGTNGLSGNTGVGAGPSASADSSCRMKLCELIAFDRLLSEAERGMMYHCIERRYRLL